MRTTLTLEPGVATRLKSEMRRSGRGLKAVVNEALKRGLGMEGRATKVPPFRVESRAFGLKPSVDPDGLNRLADELETEAAGSRLRR